jgi:hypothetical protein
MAQRIVHRIYFSPGMFGFGRLASYDYFGHLERGLEAALAAPDREVECFVAQLPPTASVRRRACRLGDLVARTADPEDRRGPIHFVGHSTGGLDARLLVSPGAELGLSEADLYWLPRVASITTISTPHFGTPLAGVFTTVSGQRMLYAVSALTFVLLSLGAPPMAAASALVLALGRLDRTIGLEIRILDRLVDSLLRALDDRGRREVKAYLAAIKEDQGAMVQLMPESMDVFAAAVRDRVGVDYQCVVTQAPAPSPRRVLRTLGTSWSVISPVLFAALYGLTTQSRAAYSARPLTDEQRSALERGLGRLPSDGSNDGVVPTLSQVRGRVAWAGYADHLDVLGHFAGAKGSSHTDWLRSGAHFDEARFREMTKAVAEGMARAAARSTDRGAAQRRG